MEGRGRMVVTAVGLNSQTGIIFKLLGAAQEQQKKESQQQRRKSKIEAAAANNASPLVAAEEGKMTTPQRDGNNNIAMRALDNNGGAAQNNLARSGSVASDAAEPEPEKHSKKEKSVLQAKLTKMAVQIGKLGSLAAVITVLILVVKFCLKTYINQGEPFNVGHFNSFVKFITIGVTVLVVAVPEGLPLAVTLSLAFSVKVGEARKKTKIVPHLLFETKFSRFEIVRGFYVFYMVFTWAGCRPIEWWAK